MPKEKAKGSPKQRYGLWLFFGLLIGIAGALLAVWGLFEPRRDMIFAETARVSVNESVSYAGFNPDGELVFSQSVDGQFRIWDSSNLALVKDYSNSFLVMPWNTNKSHFLGVEYQSAAVLFDQSGNRVTSFEHEGIYSAMWNLDGTRIITISERSAKLWTLDAHLLRELPQPINLYDSSLWSPDGSRFVAWNENQASFYDADGNELNSMGFAGYFSGYAWNSTGSAFATVEYVAGTQPAEYQIVVYNRDGEELLSDMLSGESPQIIWNASGDRLAVFQYIPQSKISLYSLEDGKIAEFNSNNVLIWHPDGERFVIPSVDGGNLILMDKNGEVLNTLPHDSNMLYSHPQWSPNGEVLASWSSSPDGGVYTLRLWDKAGNLLQEMGESSPINYVVWSPDSSKLLSVGGYIARIWSVEGGEIASLNHSQPIFMAEWTKDGTRVMTVGAATSMVGYEYAVWTSEGEHIATLFTGDAQGLYVSGWRDDFSQALLTGTNGISLYTMQAGPVYFDFRFDNP